MQVLVQGASCTRATGLFPTLGTRVQFSTQLINKPIRLRNSDTNDKIIHPSDLNCRQSTLAPGSPACTSSHIFRSAPAGLTTAALGLMWIFVFIIHISSAGCVCVQYYFNMFWTRAEANSVLRIPFTTACYHD